MCGVNNRIGMSSTTLRPRWIGLYALAGLMLAVLLLVQMLVAAGGERTTLECGLVLAGFAAMVQWTRRNRTALDHLDWCECAGSRTTVRVVPSRRVARGRHADAPSWTHVEPEESLR